MKSFVGYFIAAMAAVLLYAAVPQVIAAVGKEDGGRAFAATSASASGSTVNHQEGMSLRDYFAGQALMGRSSINSSLSYADCAKQAYEYADAMLKVREGK